VIIQSHNMATTTVTETVTTATPSNDVFRASDGSTCISSTVFGFVLVLCMLFAFGFGIGGTVWIGSRARRRYLSDSERIQRERDELRDKEVKVHSTAVQHYMGEVQHWRTEFERLQREQTQLKTLLENSGINYQRQSVMSQADRPMSMMSPAEGINKPGFSRVSTDLKEA